MRKVPVLVVVSTLTLILLSGCAVVKNVRMREGNSEVHTIAILGVPLWVNQKPVEQQAEKGGE